MSSAAPAAGPGPAWRFLAWPIAAAGWLLVRSLAATWRFEVVEGREHVEGLAERGGPAVVCGWHQNLLPLSAWLLSGPLRRHLTPVFLVSRSRDGELVSRLLRLWGGRVVRGSSSRGGREGLQALYRAVRREGASAVALPDGPRGPARRFKAGSLVLAEVTSAPLVLLAARASRCWRLRSWDRLAVPKPFSRVRVAVAAPIPVPRAQGDGDREQRLRELETVLNGLEERLEPGFSR